MIARRLPKDPEVADNFTRLAEYIAAAKDEGEKLDRFWLRNCNAGTGIEDLETALVEIDAVRRMKPAVKDKTYHLLISFRAEDRKDLSTDALRDIEEHSNAPGKP